MEQQNRFNVAIIDSRRGAYLEEPDIEQEILKSCATVTHYRVDRPDELIGIIEETDALIAWHHISLQPDILVRLRRCRGIVRAGVGFDNISIRFAAELGIPVCNIPDYGTEEVADHTLALILALVRKICVLDKHVREGGWEWQTIGSVARLRGSTLGIIGFGRIGSAVARRAQAFGLNVTFYDPFVPSGTDKSHGVERCETLHELLDQSQIISLHVPLSDETNHLIGRAEMERMTSKTILINTSRGQVIDQHALIEYITDGRIGQVGLDVLNNEPNVPTELVVSSRVLLTAHSAFYTDASLEELRRKAAQAVCRLLLSQPERNILNGVLSGARFLNQQNASAQCREEISECSTQL